MIATEAVLRKVRALPALSTSAIRVQELARDDRSSAADFERVIRPDPALTANLLKIANSAYFGLRCRADSVRQAVTLLGIRRTAEVAAAAALAPVIPERIPGYEIVALDFWRHSVGVAVLAERLAAELELHPSDGLFTAALLHDIGKLAIASFVADESYEILTRSRSGMALVEAEREVLGVDHTEVGGAVSEAWRLPPAVTATACWHHAPGEAPDDEHRTTIDLVHLADALAHALGLGTDAGELARAIDPVAETRIDLKPRTIERVAAESLDEISELAALLRPAPGSHA